MSCSKYPLIKVDINTGNGGRGPTGPQGPQGPPGEGVDLPLSSIDVDYRGQDLQSLLDELLYEELEIPSFSVSPSVVEIGTTLNNLTLNWSYNKAIGEQTITGPNTNLSPLISERQVLLTALGLTTTATFTLAANDGSNVKTKQDTVNFWNYMFWGVGVPGEYDSNFIKSLSGKELKSNRNRTVTVTAGNNQKAYIAIPKRFGIPVMEVGGFEGGFEDPLTINFTNFANYVEEYYLIESEQFGLGTITITVK